MAATASKFDASASALGYLYQVEFALLATLLRLGGEPDVRVRLEVIDDVSFETDGSVEEILQTKCTAAASLTDRSEQLWKTLRIWISLAKTTLLDEVAFGLVTTSVAQPDSIAALLRSDDKRSVPQALERLDRVAADNPAAEANEKAYEAWNQLEASERRELLERITVYDGAPDIANLHRRMLAVLQVTLSVDHAAHILGDLKGLWYQLAVDHLRGMNEAIDGITLSEFIHDRVRQLRDGALPPIQVPALTTVQLSETYGGMNFVLQMELVGVGSNRTLIALQDYHRVYAHRSAWERERLLKLSVLNQFDQSLRSEWASLRAPIMDDWESAVDPDDKLVLQETGRKILDHTFLHAKSQLNGVESPEVRRGSLHILADQLDIGWHPNYKSELGASE